MAIPNSTLIGFFKDIQLYINSPGGSVTAGFAIYDTMQYIKCDVSTICVGLAASFGAFLLAGGAHGKRMALANSEIMIHQPAIHGNGIQGQASDIRIMSDHIQKNKQRLHRILAENTGRTIEEIERDTDRDNFMSADEALEYGLIDSVISQRLAAAFLPRRLSDSFYTDRLKSILTSFFPFGSSLSLRNSSSYPIRIMESFRAFSSIW